MVKHIEREASELGLTVGTWPSRINIDGVDYKIVRFETDGEGDLKFTEYRSKHGETLIVFND